MGLACGCDEPAIAAGLVLVNGSISVVDDATAQNSIHHESLSLIYNTKFAIGEMQARLADE